MKNFLRINTKVEFQMNSAEQQFLNDLDKKLWAAADRLRSNLDAANYKHVVLGRVDLCCTYFTQQYMGSHIIENASDTILA